MIDVVGICQESVSGEVNSFAGFLWQGILFLWPWHWLLIICFLAALIVWEIYTRNGKFHYNSKNGYSPCFNRFVGSGTYLLVQTLFFLILTKVFGGGVYCLLWPFPVHILFFCLTGLLLHKIGFWPYLNKNCQKFFDKIKNLYKKYINKR